MDKARQVAVDPEALRALGAGLSALASKVVQMQGDLDRGLAVLGQTFQDDQYQQFRSGYSAARQKLTAFADDVRGLVPKLAQDADAVAAAQRVRLDG
jgi:uncharacterized protein YukE